LSAEEYDDAGDGYEFDIQCVGGVYELDIESKPDGEECC
jgi:hypothetical protein